MEHSLTISTLERIAFIGNYLPRQLTSKSCDETWIGVLLGCDADLICFWVLFMKPAYLLGNFG